MGTLTINNTYCGALYTVEYGLLYNWYAATYSTGGTSIAPIGWHVPTQTEINTLATTLGGVSVAGGKLKETGTTYWNSPNTGATNESGFNLRGSGFRSPTTGVFDTKGTYGYVATITVYLDLYIYHMSQVYNSAACVISANSTALRSSGLPIRLIKDDSTDANIMTGNDGKIYRTIKIGSQVWLADNLAETKFRNGDTIPWYGANQANYFTNAEWAALTTAGVCAYNNDVNNVAPGFTFPS